MTNRRKQWQVKHISDEQCREAARRNFTEPMDGDKRSTLQHLVDITGAPTKVCYRKLQHISDGERMDYGVGAHQAWWVADLPYDRPAPGPFAVKATLDLRPAGMRSEGNPLVPQGIAGLVRRR